MTARCVLIGRDPALPYLMLPTPVSAPPWNNSFGGGGGFWKLSPAKPEPKPLTPAPKKVPPFCLPGNVVSASVAAQAFPLPLNLGAQVEVTNSGQAYFGLVAGVGLSYGFSLSSTTYSPYQRQSVDDVASDQSFFAQIGLDYGIGQPYNDSGTAYSQIASNGPFANKGVSYNLPIFSPFPELASKFCSR